VIYWRRTDGAQRFHGLALDVTYCAGPNPERWTVRMKHTPLSRYDRYPSGRQSSGPRSIRPIQRSPRGLGTLLLHTPFDYNGTDNLMIDFSFDNDVSPTRRSECHADRRAAGAQLHDRCGPGDPLMERLPIPRRSSMRPSPTCACSPPPRPSSSRPDTATLFVDANVDRPLDHEQPGHQPAPVRRRPRTDTRSGKVFSVAARD